MDLYYEFFNKLGKHKELLKDLKERTISVEHITYDKIKNKKFKLPKNNNTGRLMSSSIANTNHIVSR